MVFILRTALYAFSGRHGFLSGMSTIGIELDGLCPLGDFDSFTAACSVEDLDAVADDVADASVVTVAVGLVLVDTVTTVDLMRGELVVLVDIAGDAARYGSVTRMNPGVAVTIVDVAGVATAADAVGGTTLVDDVTVARFWDGVVVEAGSEASSEMTTVSWKSTSISGIMDVTAVVDVAACC